MNMVQLCLLLPFAAATLQAQTYRADFTDGIPAGWSMQAGDSILWEPSSFGDDESGSLMADFSFTSGTTVSTLQTPWLDLTSAAVPSISFSFATVRNNFVGPSVSLWYDSGSGPERIRCWGEFQMGALSPIDSIIDAGNDYQPPLDSGNFVWNRVQVMLPELTGATNVRFLFRAEIVNGGWVLLDDVAISGSKTSGVRSGSGTSDHNAELSLRPVPATSFLAVESVRSYSTLRIVDKLGRTVEIIRGDKRTSDRIDLQRFSAGIYWIELSERQGDRIALKSFVRQ